MYIQIYSNSLYKTFNLDLISISIIIYPYFSSTSFPSCALRISMSGVALSHCLVPTFHQTSCFSSGLWRCRSDTRSHTFIATLLSAVLPCSTVPTAAPTQRTCSDMHAKHPDPILTCVVHSLASCTLHLQYT